MKKIPFYHEMIATGLGVGHFPYGPGTMGALLAILIWYPITTMANHTTWFIITLALILVFTLLGAWSSTVAERYWGEDPSRVVIDEVVGQWITLLAVPAAFSWWHVLAAFILFRFFDIIKPLGVRKMENFNSGWGIMADDILAGCYGAILIYLLSIIEW
ncbi:MAG: phosphatidylglycerophosphatase A [Bacteroidaceae bacterium]|nr:phosphatidylglycerophosphatase A [Bacteroidaceae bacterium]